MAGYFRRPPALDFLEDVGRGALQGTKLLGSALGTFGAYQYQPFADAVTWLTGIETPNLVEQNLPILKQEWQNTLKLFGIPVQVETALPKKTKAKKSVAPPKNQAPLPIESWGVGVPTTTPIPEPETPSWAIPTTLGKMLPEILPTPSTSYTGSPKFKPQEAITIRPGMSLGEILTSIANEKLRYRQAMANYYNAMSQRETITKGALPYIGPRSPQAKKELLQNQINAQRLNMQALLKKIKQNPYVEDIISSIFGITGSTLLGG